MPKYAVNWEAIAAMRATAGTIREAAAESVRLTEAAQCAAVRDQFMLGPYGLLLEEVLDAVKQSLTAGKDSPEYVAEHLEYVANAYEEILKNDLFGTPAPEGLQKPGVCVDAAEPDSEE